NGFTVKVNAASPSMLDQLKKEAGISDKFASCHTAKIDGYVIEGHVPASDIKRLISEKPEAICLTVPGMVAGSPGMEQGGKYDPYKVLLVKKDGTTEQYSRQCGLGCGCSCGDSGGYELSRSSLRSAWPSLGQPRANRADHSGLPHQQTRNAGRDDE